MHLKLPQPLPDLVETKFVTAEESKNLIFSATDVCIIRTSTGIPFQLRYCPALAKKPKSQNDDPQSTPKKKFDPFETPPQELFIADVPGPSAADASHILVLNKYPVIRDHVILATKENKPQTHLLELDDLAATYAVLREWEQKKAVKGDVGRMFAFFNSGEHSGASQPHRHIQFLPVDRMGAGEKTQGWELLIDQVIKAASTKSIDFLTHPFLPFAHFAQRLPPNPSAEELHTIYTALYTRALEHVKDHIASQPSEPNKPTEFSLHSVETGDSAISYNLALTSDAMIIAPRRKGGDNLRGSHGEVLEEVELNGTVLGGTLMVKAQEQWDLLRKDEMVLTRLLESLGLPWTKSVGSKEAERL